MWPRIVELTWTNFLPVEVTGGGKVHVDNWACCLEQHEHTSGQHYHVYVKLSRLRRWNPIRLVPLQKYNVNVKFLKSGENYYAAYKYD